jgi:hypothetical protein
MERVGDFLLLRFLIAASQAAAAGCAALLLQLLEARASDLRV